VVTVTTAAVLEAPHATVTLTSVHKRDIVDCVRRNLNLKMSASFNDVLTCLDNKYFHPDRIKKAHATRHVSDVQLSWLLEGRRAAVITYLRELEAEFILVLHEDAETFAAGLCWSSRQPAF
jgi:hypothetical protein